MPVILLTHLGIALLVSAVLIGLGMFRQRRVLAVTLSLVLVLFFPLLIPFPFFRYLGVVLLPTLLLSLWLRASGRTTLVMSGLPIFCLLGWVTQERLAEVALIDRLRTRFPVESLAQRLAGETQHAPNDETILLSPEVASELQQEHEEILDIHSLNGSREKRLKLLHDESYREFVASDGFGSRRTWPSSLQSLDLPDPQPVPMPNRPSLPDSYLADRERERQGYADQASPVALEIQTEGRNIHGSAKRLFLDVRQWGYVPDRDHVVGFQAHHVSEVPHTGTLYTGETRRWAIAQLQLVSLLKHDTPRVYVSENLPDMKELAEAKNRDLTKFEATALLPLERDTNLVIDEAPFAILMLGALRANESCQECHRVPKGALLGAFSYVLTPLDANAK